MISFSFGDTAGNDTDADLRDEFNGDARTWVRTLEVIDELLQILNGVDIVVGRGRDETDTCGGMTSAGDRGGNLVSRKLTAFTRLRSLGHLDLKLISIREVI